MADAGTPNALIALEHVWKEFQSKDRQVTALADISLTVFEGEFAAILGPSGCGKTTILRMLAGSLQPTTGSVQVGGASNGRLRSRKQSTDVGFVFQDARLLPWRTVRENVELSLEIRAVAKKEERKAIAEDFLRLVNLDGFSDALPHELSGGMQQRVSIARALCYEPNLLLLDEPFGALDAQTRDRMNLELQEIWMKSQKTTVLVTHSISEAVFLADSVVLLSSHPGRVNEVKKIPFPRPRSLSLLDAPDFRAVVKHFRDRL